MRVATNLRILVVDMGGNVRQLRKNIGHVASQISEVDLCAAPRDALEQVRFGDYDAVLVDWRSGGGSLNDVEALVRASPMVPVIAVSHETDQEVQEQMLRVGVQDYLIKRETHGVHLIRSISNAMERKRLETRLKTTLGELAEANARLKRLTMRDPLTGALNRRAFFAVAEQALARAKRHGRTLAVLYFDLDGFKEINDELGHGAGDMLLKAFCERLARSLRRGDHLARLGGDEFVALLEDVGAAEGALDAARNIRTTLLEPMSIEGREVPLRASIGIATFPTCPSVQSLVQNADAAMYDAKQRKGCGISLSVLDAPEAQRDNADA